MTPARPWLDLFFTPQFTLNGKRDRQAAIWSALITITEPQPTEDTRMISKAERLTGTIHSGMISGKLRLGGCLWA
jgi:hypothetical protein